VTIATLVDQLSTLGILLWEDAGTLRFRAPHGIMNDERRALLSVNKAAILAWLRQQKGHAVHEPTRRYAPFPLTDLQGAYLLGRRKEFAFGGVGCHAYGELDMGELDPERLQHAWSRVVSAHDMLRVMFSMDGWQCVFPQAPEWQIQVEDWRSLDSPALAFAAARIVEEMSHRVYEPSEWPLFDLRLSRRPTTDVLHFSIDFLITDYGGIAVILSDLRHCYEDPDFIPPPPPIQFADWVAWQRLSRDTPRFKLDREYWLARAVALPDAPHLPRAATICGQTDEPRFERHAVTLDRENWEGFSARARTNGLTCSVAVLAAYAEVLGCWSDSLHFSLTLTLVDRPQEPAGIERLVGDFTSVSILEVDQRGWRSFAERALAIRDQLVSDLDHRLFSGVEVLRERARIDPSCEVIFPIVYTSALALRDEASAIGSAGVLRSISQTPQVWMDCQVREVGGGLSVNWDVRTGVLDNARLQDMFKAFENLLHDLAHDDSVWHAPAPCQVAPPSSQAWLVDSALPVSDLVSPALAFARARPNAIAIRSDQGDLSYSELFKHAEAVRRLLVAAGVGAGDIIAVCIPKGPATIWSLLGVLMAGAAYLPIEPDDPRRERLTVASAARVALVSGSIWLGPDILHINIAAINSALELPTESAARPDGLAYLIHTSGSTGDPKGVMISHAAAWNTIVDINRRFALGPADIGLMLSSPSFDLSVYDIFGLLGAGGSLVIPEAGRELDPVYSANLIDTYKITVWNSVPALMEILESYLRAGAAYRLSSLRLIMLSGDRVTSGLASAVRMRFPKARTIALGGATEASIWSNFQDLAELSDGAEMVPYGKALTGQTITVLDQALRERPLSVVGEIYIGGDGLALGYLRDEALSRERFADHPDGRGRIYRTGDLGRFLPDGSVEILGRVDRQIKIRGFRIELGEVESAVDACPVVARSVCAASREAGARLVAFVEPARAELPFARAVLRDIPKFSLRPAEGGPFAAYLSALNAASEVAIIDAFAEAGLFSEDRSYSEAEIIDALAMPPKLIFLVRRWLALLSSSGRLLLTDWAGWRSAGHRLNDRGKMWERIAQLGAPFDAADLINYFRRSGTDLLQLLRGEKAAQDYLFPGGSNVIASALFERSELNRVANTALSELAGTIIGPGSSRRAPVVLELGAGTGGTTAALLAALPNVAEYWFTDLSHYFLQEGRARFGGDPRFRFLRCDITSDLTAQGLPVGGFDLIVAGDVLHVSADVRRLLARLPTLLAPGGWLLATEMTVEHAQILTSLALLNLAQEIDPSDPRAADGRIFLNRAEWSACLDGARADEVIVLPEDVESFAETGMIALAARFGEHIDRAAFADEVRQFLKGRLPVHMVPSEIHVVERLPIGRNDKIDRSQLLFSVTPAHNRPRAADDKIDSQLLTIWRDLLALDTVDPDVQFMAAGGDSLLAARLTGRLIEELPEAAAIFFDDLLQFILESPTPAELHTYLAGNSGARVAQVEAVRQVADIDIMSIGELEGPLVLFVEGAYNEPEDAALRDTLARLSRAHVARTDAASSIPQQAVRLIGDMQSWVEQGPLLVAGAAGAALALELASQLQHRGSDPCLVFVFAGNTLPPPPDKIFAGDVAIYHCVSVGDDPHWRGWQLGTWCLGVVEFVEASATLADTAAAVVARAA
jgi:pyochelin synthetase